MVSQSTPVPDSSSRRRLLAAAAAEFAARGFDGAKVDRIARIARLNKAMLYYHFDSKAALYRTILGDVFAGVAAAVAREQQAPGTPDERLRRFIRAVSGEMAAHPHLPAIWLREMADGGRHLDTSIVQHLTAVLATLAQVLEEGATSGVFRRAHPFVTQISIVAPLLMFSATAPMRERFRHLLPRFAPIDREAVIGHVEAATLAGLHDGAAIRRRAAPRRRPHDNT